MRTAVIPQVRVAPELRAQLDAALTENETLSDFVEHYQRTGISHAAKDGFDSLQAKLDARRKQVWGLGVSEAFAADFSDPAKDDLSRRFEFLLLRASTAEEFERVQETIDELRLAIEVQPARAPFNYRKSGSDPLRRELVVPVGATGHVGRALQHQPGTEAGAVVPERHPTSLVQRVRATPSRRAGRPQTRDCLPRRHSCRDGAIGLYAAPQRFACRNCASRVRIRDRLPSFNATPAVLAIAPDALCNCQRQLARTRNLAPCRRGGRRPVALARLTHCPGAPRRVQSFTACRRVHRVEEH